MITELLPQQAVIGIIAVYLDTERYGISGDHGDTPVIMRV